MANETARAGQAASQQAEPGKQSQRQGGQQPAQEESQGGSQSANLPSPANQANPPASSQNRAIAVRPAPDVVFDPHGAIRVGMLRLARNWANEGHVYSAINTYREILTRYPETGAASAAVEDMLELAQVLEQRGMYFTALNLFHTMEDLV